MDTRERILTLLSGEEPDHPLVLASDTVRIGSPGGWVRRLTERGVGLIRRICPYRPHFNFPPPQPVFVPDVRWSTESTSRSQTRCATRCPPVGTDADRRGRSRARSAPMRGVLRQGASRLEGVHHLFRQLARVMA
jgi:hypothetical protein